MVTSWKDRIYTEAMFGGAKFQIDASEYATGRKLVVHDLPEADDPLVENRGRKTRRIRMTGYLIGDDYPDQVERLLQAIEGQGRNGALLQHPYLGVFLVFCEDCVLSHTRREGRMASVALTFVRHHPHAIGLRTSAPRQEARAAADNLAGTAGAGVEGGLATTGVPEDVRVASSDALTTAGLAMQKLDVFSGPGRKVADYARKVSNLITNATALAKAPADLVFAVRSALDAVASAAQQTSQVWAAYDVLLDLEPALKLGTGPTDAAINRNAQLVTNLVRQNAIAGQLRVLPALTWDYLEQALAARERLLAAIEAVIGQVDDTTYQALQRARAAAIAFMPPESSNLPHLADFTTVGETNTLRLTFQLYGSLDREQDLIARNQIPHPGLIGSGVELEVLVDD